METPIPGALRSRAARTPLGAKRLQDRAALVAALESKPCICGRPAWCVVSTQGRTRYVKCRCGRRGKVVLRSLRGCLQ